MLFRERTDSAEIHFDGIFDLIGRIGHSTINPFKDNIPYRTDIEGDKIIRLQITNQFFKNIVGSVSDQIELRNHDVQLKEQEM